VAQGLGPDLSWSFSAVAINRIAGVTTVAIEDPADTSAVARIAEHLGTPVLTVHAGARTIEECLEHFFPKGFESRSDIDAIVEHLTPSGLGLTLDATTMSYGAEPEGDDQPVVQLVRSIIEDACTARASDIHLEPRTDTLVIRLRIDGSLHQRVTLPKFWGRPVLSRLKIMAGLDISQRRLPQDGRILVELQGRRVDLRLATTTTTEGEGAVLRILDGGRQILTLEQLGLDHQQLSQVRRIFSAREGFVLATGPSGSGKTTTLYGMLRELNTPERKIVTLEDPVESELEAAFQIGVNPKIGLTFGEGLRSVLRLDPDVILVGEIRDGETARTAVQAALTGHLVLSSLATLGTAATISRLQDIGVDRFLVADTLRGVIAQRLVKRVCRHCRRPARPSQLLLDLARVGPDDGPFFAGSGCDQCRNTGYMGRIALFEIMVASPELYSLIGHDGSSAEIQSAAVADGMITMFEDGLAKVRAGQTTLEEVVAVTRGSMKR
ncbi:MAG: type II/IV secretion system protein, partial [Phycisphaerales bacterium]|nr:type II/IV secretion system protein [Phycisphaerales bacterium]